jgi:hypothetical protein
MWRKNTKSHQRALPKRLSHEHLPLAGRLGVAIVCTVRGLPNLTTPRKSRTVQHPCREPLQFRGFALVQSCAVWHDKVCQALADLTVPELFTTSLLLPDLLHF